MRKRHISAFAISLCMLLLTACAEPNNSATAPVELRYGIQSAWDALMPYNSVSGSNYARLIYDKLYDRLAFVRADGTLLPRGALSWEGADGGMSALFHLDERAKFHDGTPVTAAHWVQTLRLVTDPACPALGRVSLAALAGTDETGCATGGALGVEEVDAYTLKLTFKQPTTPEAFLQERNREIYVLPTHLLAGTSPEEVMQLALWQAPIGSGPCKFESEISGAQLILTANKNYPLGAPAFDTMRITVMERASLQTALISGDLDYYAIGCGVSHDDAAAVQQAGLTVLEGTVPNIFYELMLNNTHLNRDTRVAIAAALDRDTLCAQNTGGRGWVTNSSMVGFAPGLPIEPAGQPETSAVYTMAVTAARASLAAMMQQQLKAAGLTVVIEQVDSATLFAGMVDGSFDMAIASHTPGWSPIWFTESRFSEDNNLFRVPDLSEYQRLIGAVQASGGGDAEVAALEAYLAYEMPFVPLWFSVGLHAQSPTLAGVDYESAVFSNENIWQWTFQ